MELSVPICGGKVTSITETVSTYVSPTGIANKTAKEISVNIFPNPGSDLIAIQFNDIITENIGIELYDINGRLVQKTFLNQGSTIAFFDTKTLYSGDYIIRITDGNQTISRKATILK
jgi:hypothetical protein